MHLIGFQATVLLFLATLVAADSVPGKIVKGIDSSLGVSKKVFKLAHQEGFVHFVSRGYQANGGGGIDPHFLQNTINAYEAGYKGKYDIDTYWFPCSGRLRHCKPYPQQVQELVDFIHERNMPVGRVYLNIELDKTKDGNWNYGRENGGNLEQAKQMMAALKSALPNSGIYTSPGEWFNIFSNFTAVVDNSVPLWYATWAYDRSQGNLYPPQGQQFGGWQNGLIIGKQYTNVSTSRLFDLNIFVIPENS